MCVCVSRLHFLANFLTIPPSMCPAHPTSLHRTEGSGARAARSLRADASDSRLWLGKVGNWERYTVMDTDICTPESQICIYLSFSHISVFQICYDLTSRWIVVRNIHVYIYIYMYGGFIKWWYSQMDGSWWKIPLKWMIWGYPHLWKPPYIYIYVYTMIDTMIHTIVHTIIQFLIQS